MVLKDSNELRVLIVSLKRCPMDVKGNSLRGLFLGM